MNQTLRRAAVCAAAALLSFMATPRTSAQSAQPVAQLDLSRFTGSYYEIERLPIKAEKKCIGGGTMLWALSDKKNTFMLGTFCKISNGSEDNKNLTGKLDKRGGGRLNVSHLVLFHTKYWVLSAAPDYSWALIGFPNHKALWILSRTRTLAPEIVAQLQSTAAAQGFKTAKLQRVDQPQNAHLAAAE